jgi:GntR family transcriptional regulator, transcriptional repressor for pyruvate dehydrogenase complex
MPRAQAVADALRVIVRDRHLMPGDKLPSELELVETLGVGRSSVREGIQLLESIGIVNVEQGKGTFLSSTIGGGLRRVIDWAYGDDADRLPIDLLEARFIVETAQARLAALRATDEEVEELKRISSDPGHVEGEAQGMLESGLDYHHHIARAAHNDILLIMSNAVRPLIIPDADAKPRSPKEIASLLGWHTQITAAIARRDPDAAANAMRQHLEENGRSLGIWPAEGDGDA